MTNYKNNKLMVLAFTAILILVVVGVLVLVNGKGMKTRYTDFSSDEEYANVTAVLNIPAGEEGDAPGSCKISFISKSSVYPVTISDISLFYEFSEAAAPCNNGSLTVYGTNSSPQDVMYVNVVLDNESRGELETDALTGVTYSRSFEVTGETASLYLAIDETDESFSAEEIVKSILLTEVGNLFSSEGNADLMSDYSDLGTMGLELTQ